jgi:ribonuclease P protein component
MNNLQHTLPKEQRLRRPAEFRRVFDRKRSVNDEWLIVYGCENGRNCNRLGLSVSRKQGPAIHRNRLRRLYREAYRLTQHDMPLGLDLILIPSQVAEPVLAELRTRLPRLVRRLATRLQAEAKRP